MGPAIWLALARDELRAAELLAEHGIAPLSYQHADQAIEKALLALRAHREKRSVETSWPGGEGEIERQGDAKRRGIAAALAALAHPCRPPAGNPAHEAVQAAHDLIERITARVYADDLQSD